jgi:hypothetical protein
MNRREKIVLMCNLDGKGLEIGPSIRPIVPKCEGYNVETVDHADKESLQKIYSAHGHDVDSIEEVDYIWSGQPYTELTGKTNYYDYIIASHVIEHTCDLIGFLRDCSNILNENGVLSLAIPDKRFCYDYLRPTSSISKVIDSHLKPNTVHTPGTLYEHVSNACSSNGNISWTYLDLPVDISPVHNLDDSVSMYEKSLKQEEYIDVHNWVFTKNSFELLIYDLNCLGLLDMQIIKGFETTENEFFVSLGKMKNAFVPSTVERFNLAVNSLSEYGIPNQNQDLIKQISANKQEITRLKQEISDMLNSKTWKTGKKMQKIYRAIIP